MKIYLKEPNLDEYWYEQKLLSDPLTMEYNAGWEVSYDGYDYQTGCINFPEEKWEFDFNRRKKNNRYFAYIINKENDEFVGKVNFQYNEKEKKYYCGVVIEAYHRGKGYGKEALKLLCEVAKTKYNITSFTDSFEETRIAAIRVFESVGFKVVNKYKSTRFKKEVEIVEVQYDF